METNNTKLFILQKDFLTLSKPEAKVNISQQTQQNWIMEVIAANGRANQIPGETDDFLKPAYFFYAVERYSSKKNIRARTGRYSQEKAPNPNQNYNVNVAVQHCRHLETNWKDARYGW